MTDFGCRAKLFLRFFDEIANQTGHNIAKSAYLPRERLQENIQQDVLLSTICF